jgi:hypothetical protein
MLRDYRAGASHVDRQIGIRRQSERAGIGRQRRAYGICDRRTARTLQRESRRRRVHGFGEVDLDIRRRRHTARTVRRHRIQHLRPHIQLVRATAGAAILVSGRDRQVELAILRRRTRQHTGRGIDAQAQAGWQTARDLKSVRRRAAAACREGRAVRNLLRATGQWTDRKNRDRRTRSSCKCLTSDQPQRYQPTTQVSKHGSSPCSVDFECLQANRSRVVQHQARPVKIHFVVRRRRPDAVDFT